MTLVDARTLLGVTDATSPAEIQAAYRRATMAAHQALGVHAAGPALRDLAEARTVAVAAARAAPCPTCEGVGYTATQRGWVRIEVMCAACGGTGKRHAG